MSLLDPQTLTALDRLAIAAKNRVRGTVQGKRRSRRLGASLDFADYRLYTPGDDIRQLDWNAYGRTGKPFVKLFLDERELPVHLYIDASRSMGFGTISPGAADAPAPPLPAADKFTYARQLAAAVGYIALSGSDRVDVKLFGERVHAELPPMRGKGSLPRLLGFLQQASLQPAGRLEGALRRPAAVPARPGISWVFSDFLEETGVRETLAYLQAARQEVVAVQVLAREELSPQLAGDLRLIDSERRTGKEVALSSAVLRAYRAAAREYTEGLRAFCRERGMAYVLAMTDVPVAEQAALSFRREGLLD